MKWIKMALASGVSLLAMTAHAFAGFGALLNVGFALWAGPVGAALPFVTPVAFAVGLQVAAYAAVLGAQAAAFAQSRPKIDPGEFKNTFQESELSEYNGIGRVRVGGLKAFGNTKGSVISRLIWHLRGPMVAPEEYHVGGRSVIVENDGRVSSPPWVRDGGDSYLWIQTKAGTGNETAWPQLMADFPDLWTPAHRCRGIFQSLARYVTPDLDSESGNKKFQNLYQGGPPDINITARVTPVYDPRDAGQHPDNEGTWEWSDNGILCAAHIMRRYPDLSSSDFDWDFIAQEAHKADQIVQTLNGTEPRARCWGVWPSESKRNEVMQQVLDSIGAEVVMSDEGLIRIRLVEDAPESEQDFPALHIEELNWKSGPDAVERPNVCRIRYYSPERGYDMGEINLAGIEWAHIDDEISRYGEKIFDVELPFCPSASQAQRIGRRLFLQARADAGDIRTNMVGMMGWDVTYATIRDEDAEEDMLCRLAAPRASSKSPRVGIPYIVWPKKLIDEPWNPPTMEAPPPEPAPDLQYESDLPDPAKPSAGGVVRYSDGTYETRMKFSGISGGTEAEARYRSYTNGNPNLWQPMTEYNEHGWYAWAADDTRGVRVDFRSQFFNDDDEGSYPSPELTVDPMAIDNTPPGEPNVGVSTENLGGSTEATFSIWFPEIRGITVQIETWSDGVLDPGWVVRHEFKDVRPGDEHRADLLFIQNDSSSYTVDWRVSVLTSNGTRSPYATGSINVPQT